MARMDHSLDDKIVQAARAEFLLHGFQKASLHKIAQRAGITTGALYTRYRNKDALFCSLVQGAMQKIRLQPLRENYAAVLESKNVDDLLRAIRAEERVYLDLMFEYYDECVLFFCRSAGSSIGTMIEQMMERKAAETVKFLGSIAKNTVDPDGIALIMSEQFHTYQRILEKGYTKEHAISCIETMTIFQEAGWKALFSALMD